MGWKHCACPAGYTGVNCSTEIDECVTNGQPCKNGATCRNDEKSGYSCNCPMGYTGTNCSTEIDYCLNSSSLSFHTFTYMLLHGG